MTQKQKKKKQHQSYSICLVDDSPQDVKLVKNSLERIPDWEFRVHYALQPDRIFSVLVHLAPDLILLDHRLQGTVTGLDLLKTLRDHDTNIPVIFMTGFGNEQLVSEVFRQNLTEYIPKNEISPSKLKQVMKRLISRYQYTRYQKKKLKVLAHQARTDELTGLRNRRVLKRELKKEMKRFQRYGHSFCVLMLDVDDFKQVNDRFGHSMGDFVLKRIGKILHEEKRISDTAARIGGDEFCLLLLNSNGNNARKVAGRIRENVKRSLATAPEGEPLNITCTAGIYCVNREFESPEAILDVADNALYRGKQNKNGSIVRCTTDE